MCCWFVVVFVVVWVLPLLLLGCWLVRVVNIGVLLLTMLLDDFVGLRVLFNVVLCFLYIYIMRFVGLLLLRCCG